MAGKAPGQSGPLGNGRPPINTYQLSKEQTALVLAKLGRVGQVGQTIRIQAITSSASSSYPRTATTTTIPVSRMQLVPSTMAASQGPRLVQAESSHASSISTAGVPRTIKIGSPRAAVSSGSSGPLGCLLSTGVGGAMGNMVNSGGSLGSLIRAVNTPQKQSGFLLASASPQTELSSGGRGGKRQETEFDTFSESKRRKTDKGGKGLRHFSMKVCEKVKEKGKTTYNEVADELVTELTDPRCASPSDQQYDQKNIRRRVYDALNVLMAMNIISKEKKEIKWLGLPTNSVQEATSLEEEKGRRMERIKAKTEQLQDLILQQIAFKNLVERNKEAEKKTRRPPPSSVIEIPFIIVSTDKETQIEVAISSDKREWLFDYNNTFEIHDDMVVLNKMGMAMGLEKEGGGQVSEDDLRRARGMVPKALETYVVQMAQHGPGTYSMPKDLSDEAE